MGLAACRPATGIQAEEGWQPVPNRYARHFQVLRNGADRLVLVFSDTAGQDTVGAYRFSAAAQPGHFPKALHRIVLGSTTHVPFVSALGGLQAVKGCAHLSDVRDTLTLQRMRAEGVKEVSTGDGLDREGIIVLHPEAILGYPFGRQEGDCMAQLNVPVIDVGEYMEEHPLGKAEWLRFFGVLLGEEERSDSLFAGIARRYEAACKAGERTGPRPRVFFGSTWEHQWFVPPGNSYMARLIEDAGGAYLFADRPGTGNITLDVESAIAQGAQAEVWGTLLAAPPPVTEEAIAGGDARIQRLPAFQGHRTFYGNSMESDLFGDAALHPDDLLADLQAIFHADDRRTCLYFRRPVQNGMPSRR
ncbi:MAG: ABC transporter substrate-binding protein [Flavobacteriales bacterium]